jgi:Protein of unknown function (DUF2510)
MSSSPAGWYMDPSAPGVARYWDGAAWSAPDAGPAAAVQGSARQADVTTPSATVPPSAELRLTAVENYADASARVEPPVPQPTLGIESASGKQHPTAEWSVVAHQGLGSFATLPANYAPTNSAPTTYEEAAYTAPPPHACNPMQSAFRRTPGWVKAAVVFGSVAVCFGARWAFTLFLAAE